MSFTKGNAIISKKRGRMLPSAHTSKQYSGLFHSASWQILTYGLRIWHRRTISQEITQLFGKLWSVKLTNIHFISYFYSKVLSQKLNKETFRFLFTPPSPKQTTIVQYPWLNFMKDTQQNLSLEFHKPEQHLGEKKSKKCPNQAHNKNFHVKLK